MKAKSGGHHQSTPDSENIHAMLHDHLHSIFQAICDQQGGATNNHFLLEQKIVREKKPLNNLF